MEFPASNCTAQEIYNFLRVLRKQFLKDRTQLEALLDLVSSGEYEHKVWVKEGMVIGLFLIYKPAIELVRRFKAVFLMDCTYQTNILQMPLLNIVGITSTYQTFNAGFAFLPDELESSYVWALSQLYDNSGIHRQSFIARLENALDSSDQQIHDMPPVTRKRGRPIFNINPPSLEEYLR